MSADLTLDAAGMLARCTQAPGLQDIAIRAIKSQADGEAAIAAILMEHAVTTAAYDHRGRVVPGDLPILDARV